MGQVLIRNLDDDVIASIRMKADLKGHSLEHELRRIIIDAAPFTREERVAMTRRIKALSPGLQPELTKEEIREGLE